MHEHPSLDPIKSIPQLLTERKTSAATWAFFQATASDIPQQDSRTLVARIATSEDPLLLWLIHEELDRRDVPPAFRWPVNRQSTQMEYITWLADIYWFTRRKPHHRPAYKSWQRWFGNVSNTWHASALRAFFFAFKRGSGAAYFAKGLALTEEAVAKRRYAMWKLYVLAGESETSVARQYHKLYGEAVARQNLGKQVEVARQAWKLFGSPRKNVALCTSTI